MRTYYFDKRMSDTVVMLFASGYRDIWTRARKRGESRRCHVTGKEIKSGDFTWRPITNGNNRMDRISDAGILELERAPRNTRKP